MLIYCPNCGKPNNIEKFCPECGFDCTWHINQAEMQLQQKYQQQVQPQIIIQQPAQPQKTKMQLWQEKIEKRELAHRKRCKKCGSINITASTGKTKVTINLNPLQPLTPFKAKPKYVLWTCLQCGHSWQEKI